MFEQYIYSRKKDARFKSSKHVMEKFFKKFPQLESEWREKITAMLENGGGYETDAELGSGFRGRDAWTYVCRVEDTPCETEIAITFRV